MMIIVMMILRIVRIDCVVFSQHDVTPYSKACLGLWHCLFKLLTSLKLIAQKNDEGKLFKKNYFMSACIKKV